MNPADFQSMISRILREEVEKRSSTEQKIYQRVPEVTHGEDLKKITPHERDGKSKEEILDAISKAVKEVDSSATVVWDDHDDISISARDLFRVRVIPRWENSYNIEAMIRNEDRIYVTGQTLEQVKEFVKINLKNSTTYADKALEKGKKPYDSKEGKTLTPDKGLPQKDKPKTLPHTNEKPNESKNKDKNYTEKAVTNEKDLPEKPMREVGEYKKQIDHKQQEPVKLRKRKPDTKLTVKM